MLNGITDYNNKQSLGEGTDYDKGKEFKCGNHKQDAICVMNIANWWILQGHCKIVQGARVNVK